MASTPHAVHLLMGTVVQKLRIVLITVVIWYVSQGSVSLKLGEKHFAWNTPSTRALFCLLFNYEVASSSLWSLQVSNHMVRQSNFADWPSWRGILFLLWVFICFRELFFHFRNKILWIGFLISLINWMLLQNKVLMLTSRSFGLVFFFSFDFIAG